jgi:hypothetical protein
MKSLGDAANLFMKLADGEYRAHLAPALNEIGRQVQGEVQREIGNYQGAIGPFPAWAPLAQATLDTKANAGLGRGYPDTPLYATGAFAQDVSFCVDLGSLSVTIGTNAPEISYTELGTRTMPPRPIFGPSCLRVLPHMLPLVASAAFGGITGGAFGGLGLRATTFSQGGSVGGVNQMGGFAP